MSLLDPGDREAARDAERALRAARRRATRRSDRFVDAYVTGFAVVMVSTWLVSFVRGSFAGTACADACRLQEAPLLTAVAVALTSTGLLVLALGEIGPVSAGRAEARWLLGTTADRSALLRGPLRTVLAGAGAAGVVAGLLVALAAAGGALALAPLTAGAAAGGLLGVLAVLLLLPGQSRAASAPPGRTAGTVSAAVGLALVLVTVAAGERLPRQRLPAGDGTWAVTASLVLAAVAAGAVVVLARRSGPHLAALSDARLAVGREVVEAVAGSVTMLDSTSAEALVRRRRAQRSGRHPSRRGRGRGALAMLDRDLTATWRRRRGLVAHLVSVPLVLAVAEGAGESAAVVCAALAGTWAARSGGAGLRTWLGSPGLRRMVTAPHLGVTAALGVVPVAVGTAVSLPALVVLGAPAWAAVHVGLAALAATMRAADPVDRDLGVVVSTPMGALPVGLVRGLLHGPDLALGLALLLVAWPQPWILPAAAGALAWQVGRDRG